MRLVSYNVRYFGHALKGLASTATSKLAIAESLAMLDPLPDVVALQEVETRSIRAGVAHRGAHGEETQLEAFMRHLAHSCRAAGRAMPYTAYYFPAHAYQVGGLKFYTTGLAALVHTGTLHVVKDNRDAPQRVTHYPRIKLTKQERIVAHLHLQDTAGRRFHLFNTHLSLPSPFRRDFWAQDVRMGHGPNQVAEAQTLLGYVRHAAGGDPSIIVGDFNSAPASPVYELLTRRGGLVGAQEALGQIDLKDPRGFPTAGFLKLRMHLDHLFASPGVAWLDLEGTRRFGDPSSPFHGLSDHVPLVASFDLGDSASRSKSS